MLTRKLISGLAATVCLLAVGVDAAVVGDWKMNEGIGSVVGDSSGNNYDFSFVGAGYSWTSTSGGLTAAPLNAAYLHTTIANNLFQYQMTVEAWVKPTLKPLDAANDRVSQFVGLEGAFGFAIVGDGTVLRFLTINADLYHDAQVYIAGWNYDLYDGNFHHVVGVFDGIRDANGKVTNSIYIDGTLAVSTPYVAASNVFVGGATGLTGTNLYFGQNAGAPDWTTQNFVGDVYGVRLTNAIPEPVAFSVLALGGLALLRRRKAF